MPKHSKTFCALPFMALDRHHQVLRPCCMNRHPDWRQYHTIDQFWNSDTLHRLRHNLENDIRDPSCYQCWDLEDKGQISVRQSVNISRAAAVDPDRPAITQVKLMTGKTCNLACMMCFSTVSSTYEQTWRGDRTWIMPEAKQRDIYYDQEMEDFIRQHAKDLRYIEVIGGEPLFNKQFLALAQWLVQQGHAEHLTLYIITNGTLLTDAMRDLFSQFMETVFVVSIDGIGLVNDYQRWPSRWSEVSDQLLRIRDGFSMSVQPTVTALNVLGLGDLHDWCNQHGIIINNMQLVEQWSQLLPHHLPQALKDLVDPRFRQFVDSDGDAAELLEFVRRWDQRRGISIVDYMPEWQGLI